VKESVLLGQKKGEIFQAKTKPAAGWR